MRLRVRHHLYQGLSGRASQARLGSRAPTSSSRARTRIIASASFRRLPPISFSSKPDLIVAVAVQPARAAKDATSDIPVVMLFVGDPVGVGLVSSLASPGGNMTGVTTLVPGGFIGKMLGILREALPQAKRLAVVINPSNETHRRLYSETPAPAAEARLST